MMDSPEMEALQQLKYDGTPEEVCKNFCSQAMETLNGILKKQTKGKEHDKVECERAMHFFDEAFETGYKEYQTVFTLYYGRAKLNLLIAQFGKCKEDCLEALKIKDNDFEMWLVLSRSRYWLEKYDEGLKYALQGLEKISKSDKVGQAKLTNMVNLFKEKMENEIKISQEITTLTSLKADKKLSVYKNIRGKKIKLGKRLHHLPDGMELQISEDKEGFLHFPVLLLYDEFMQTDFIQDWREDQKLRQHLQTVFACQAPWDAEGDYTMQTIECYFEADQTSCLDPKDTPKEKSKKKYIPLNLNMTLIEALTQANHIVPQYPVIKVISSDSDYKDSFLAEI